MKRRTLLLITVILSILMLIGCEADHTGQAKTPSGSSIQKGRDYMAVESDFREKGFTNIKYELIEDLITGWLTKDGEVEKVTVGGDPEYAPDKWLPADTEVVIYYHTFPSKEDVATTENVEESTEEPLESNTIEDTSSLDDETEEDIIDNSNEDIVDDSDDTTEDTSNEMPLLKGTSLSSAVKKASEYGVVEQYDDDFGHGTRCMALSDSVGGLMLDIIYNSSTDEILCANITTNKLASSNEQKNFVKGMAGVLCPTDDVAEVTSWVNNNVGSKMTTEISGFTYEVGLGPVDNVLYYAGNAEWETWESQHW